MAPLARRLEHARRRLARGAAFTRNATASNPQLLTNATSAGVSTPANRVRAERERQKEQEAAGSARYRLLSDRLRYLPSPAMAQFGCDNTAAAKSPQLNEPSEQVQAERNVTVRPPGPAW